MRTEKIDSNQQSYRTNSSKSIFKYIKNLFTQKPTPNTEKTFETLAKANTAVAIASIEIKKKQEEAPKITHPQISSIKPNPLFDIIPGLPKISDEELKKLKKEIRANEKITKMIPLANFKDRYHDYLDSERAQLIYKIMNNPDLMANKNIQKYSQKLLFANPFNLNPGQTKVINLILDTKRLYNNEYIMKDAINTIPTITKSNINFVLQLLTNKKFNKTWMGCGSEIIYKNRIDNNCDTITNNQRVIIDKFLNNKPLYENENVNSNIFHIIWRTKSWQDAEYANTIFDKYINSQELQKLPHVANNIGSIAEHVDTKPKLELANRILDNPLLFENKKLFTGYKNSNVHSVINTLKTTEKIEATNKFLDFYLSNKSLYHNRNLNKTLADVLATTTKDNLDFRKDILEKFIKSKSLRSKSSEVKHQLGYIINNIKDETNFKIVDKIINDEKLYTNYNLMKNLPDILIHTQRPADADIVNKFFDKTELVNDKEFIKELPSFLWDINFGTSKGYSNRTKILNKVLDNNDLYNNKFLKSDLSNLIKRICIDEQVEIMNIVLDNKELLDNPKITKSLPTWLSQIEMIGSVNMEKYLNVKKILSKFHK